MLKRRYLLSATRMKNALTFALVGCLMLGGVVAGPASASESSPRPAMFDTALPAHVLLAKKEPSSVQTTSTLTVTNVRHHAHKKYTRVVLDVTGRVKIKESKGQRKAKISLSNVKLGQRARQQIKEKTFPRAIVISPEDKRTVNIVLDVQALRTYRVLSLQQPDRVVVDLFYAQKTPGATAKSETRTGKPSKPAPDARPRSSIESRTGSDRGSDRGATRPQPTQSSLSPSKTPKGVLIVIDPGHGGRDPGTTGRRGTKEKTIVLQISKYLRDLIQQRHKANVLLTRSKDVFLDLEERVKFANQKKLEWCGKDMGANVEAKKKSRTCLFISIHVNSHPRKSIKGLEVYHFGKASDPRALEVAARENGMRLESDTPPWQFIITDNLNDHKIKQSQTFAQTTSDKLVTTLRKNYKVKNHGVKTAPFYVLRFTTMPSILAELGFVSNAMEEKRLRTQAFQKKLAEGIYQGIQAYLKEP